MRVRISFVFAAFIAVFLGVTAHAHSELVKVRFDGSAARNLYWTMHDEGKVPVVTTRGPGRWITETIQGRDVICERSTLEGFAEAIITCQLLVNEAGKVVSE